MDTLQLIALACQRYEQWRETQTSADEKVSAVAEDTGCRIRLRTSDEGGYEIVQVSYSTKRKKSKKDMNVDVEKLVPNDDVAQKSAVEKDSAVAKDKTDDEGSCKKLVPNDDVDVEKLVPNDDVAQKSAVEKDSAVAKDKTDDEGSCKVAEISQEDENEDDVTKDLSVRIQQDEDEEEKTGIRIVLKKMSVPLAFDLDEPGLRQTVPYQLVIDDSEPLSRLGDYELDALASVQTVCRSLSSNTSINLESFKYLLQVRSKIFENQSMCQRRLWAIYMALVVQLMSYVLFGTCRIMDKKHCKDMVETVLEAGSSVERARDGILLLWYALCGQTPAVSKKFSPSLHSLSDSAMRKICEELENQTGILFKQLDSGCFLTGYPKLPERETIFRLGSIQNFIVRVLQMGCLGLKMRTGDGCDAVDKSICASDLLNFILSSTFVDVLKFRAFDVVSEIERAADKVATLNYLGVLFDAVVLHFPFAETKESLEFHPFSSTSGFQPIDISTDSGRKNFMWPDKNSKYALEMFLIAQDRIEYLDKFHL